MKTTYPTQEKHLYSNLIRDFFKVYSMDDIKEQIEGELKEYGTDEGSYFFGNGELIVCSNLLDEKHPDYDGVTFVIETVNGQQSLVLF